LAATVEDEREWGSHRFHYHAGSARTTSERASCGAVARYAVEVRNLRR
jgi:hypothetical protein